MDTSSAKRRAARKAAVDLATDARTAAQDGAEKVQEAVAETTSQTVTEVVETVEAKVDQAGDGVKELTERAMEAARDYSDTTSDAEAEAELRLPEQTETLEATPETPAPAALEEKTAPAPQTPDMAVETATETTATVEATTTKATPPSVSTDEVTAAVAAAEAPYQSTMDGTDLAALLCARLCHDLVSPISAIGAALDVLQDPSAEDMHGQALDLIRKSADQGWAKLEFTRLAFGAGGSAPGRIESGELRRVTEGMFNSEKLAIDWNVEAVDTEKGVARMLLNLCLLGAEALPRGGTVNITSDIDGTHFRIESNGRRARLAPDVEAALSGRTPEEGYDARSIQPFYTNELAKRAGGKTTARVEDETVIFEAIFPEKV
jgi:histidine phosphotransferase ChpT